MMAEQRLASPFGAFELRRYPARPGETLRAWNAADRLLLDAAAETPAGHDLVVNDEHGALAVPLAAAWSWTDSALSAIALGRNQRASGGRTRVLFSTEAPPATATRVFMRVPKQLAYFEYQLATLAATLPPGTPLVAGGMDKHLSPRTAELMEHYLGPTRRHRGQRKARLFSARLEGPRQPVPSPAHYACPGLEGELESRPNVFSHDRLDRGSAFLLAQLDRLAPARRVVDLACGNGVLGLAALAAGLAECVLFCDESAMAVASARANLGRLLPARAQHCDFHHGDGLRGYRGPKAALVLCNPPFHLQHTVEDYAGRRLLGQAARHLEPGGRLCLVANSHLRYRPALERAFARVEVLARNPTFTVWLAGEPR